MTIDARMAEALAGAGDVMAAFRRMDIAEEEMATARIGRAGSSTGWVFKALCPSSEELCSAAEWVYRAHARELCQRAAADGDLRDATWAELILALSRASLDAPFGDNAALAYVRAFGEAARLGDRPELVAAPLWRERWPGAVDELLDGLRQRMRAPGRAP